MVVVVLGVLGWGHRALAYVPPSCPAGQTSLWTIGSAPQNSPCANLQTFPSWEAARTGCTPAHGVIVANQYPNSDHYAGTTQEPTENAAGHITFRTTTHFSPSNHAVSNSNAPLATATHSCVPATCEAPAGAFLDLADPFNTPNGASLCIENCQTTAFVGLGITKKGASQSGTIAFGIVNSPASSCTEGSEPESDRFRTCYQEDDLTICAYSDDPDVIGDGAIDEPDPEPDTESAADHETIDEVEGGCVTLASGAAFCVVGAADTPDNGNPGQPATPDAVVQGGNGFAGNTTYNYYSSTTVAGSSNHGDGTGNGECDPSKTNCESEGDPDGECDPEVDENCRADGKGTISGGNNCSAPPVCNNDPIQCYHSTRLWELKCALATPSSASLSTAITQGVSDGLLKEDGSALVDQIGDDFDVSTWWSPGSASTDCPPDITVEHFLGVAVIPVSEWCSVLHTIGFFVLVGAALASFRVFAQGFA